MLLEKEFRRLPVPIDNWGMRKVTVSQNFKPVPEDIYRASPLYSGTAAAIGEAGKRWRFIESKCIFDGKSVEIIFDAKTEQDAETMLTCDQGFNPDGKPTVGFFDGKDKLVRLCDATGEQIDEMPDRVFLRFNGVVHPFRINNRYGGAFEYVEAETTSSWIGPVALGLLSRGYFGSDGRRHVYLLYTQPFQHYPVAVEANEDSPNR